MGYGFSTFSVSEARCLFSYDNFTVSGGHPTNVSITSFLCRIPNWNGPMSPNGTLEVNFNVTGISGHAQHSIFTYFHGWDSLNSSVALADGGESLMISGAGFNMEAANGKFKCVFARPPYSASSLGEVLSDRQISCKSPEWMMLDETHTSRLSQSKQEPGFTFVSVWNSSSLSVTHFAPAGGERVQIKGFGFVGDRTYSCVWTSTNDPSQYVISDPASVLGPTEIECTCPEWQFTYGNVTLSLLDNGQLVSSVDPQTLDLQMYQMFEGFTASSGSATGGAC